MQDKVFNWLYRMRQVRFVDLTQRTLRRLFPFALIGSFFSAFRKTFLDEDGFLSNIFNVPDWLPYYHGIDKYFQGLTHLTLGILGILAAFYMADLTVKKYSGKDHLAGMVAAISYIILFSPNPLIRGKLQLADLTFYTGTRGLIFGLLFGYLIGNLFGVVYRRKAKQIDSTSILMPLTLFILLITTAGNIGLIALTKWHVYNNMIGQVGVLTHSGTLLQTWFGTFLTTVLKWFGLSGPFNLNSSFSSTNANANLMYALKHHSAWHVPYPFTEESLYDSFGLFGGIGGVLALSVAIILVSRSKKKQSIVSSSFIPTLFGSGQGLMIGLPILFNPIYLIPFIMVPMVNVTLAAIFVALRIMPPAIYPIPVATPGPLIALMGSGGNCVAFILGIGMFILDVFIYIPFVRLDNKILERLNAKVGGRI